MTNKHLFTPYNGVPGYEAWVRFERDLFKYGGTADDRGNSDYQIWGKVPKEGS